MPSTYTDNGGIELPANGEQSATWGNTVNDNSRILDRLTNGVGAITLSGTTHTLTTSDGALSNGQYKVLVLGGSPSGTNTVTVAPNNGQHIYIVKNGSGQTATFTQGSGANVSVSTGTTKIIYCDGAGSGAAVVDITGSLDLGALVIGGTIVTATGAELNIMDGVTATTAELNILDGVTATAAELNYNDTGAAVGTVVASKTVTADGNKDVASLRNLTITGELDAATLDISGAVDIDGALQLDATFTVGVNDTGYDVKFFGDTASAYMQWDASADDLILGGAAGIVVPDGKLTLGSTAVIATATELNFVDGVTSSIQTQINALPLTPAGAVMPFAMSTVPSGWLECNGAAVSRSTYSALFSAIGTTYGAGDGSSTFKVPDMRGEFPRGWDNSRGIDSGRGIGSSQADDFKSHSHTRSATNGFGSGGAAFDVTRGSLDGGPFTATTSATGGTETRPRNIALMYCIKG